MNLLPHDIEAKRRNPKPRSRSELVEPELKIMVREGGKTEKMMRCPTREQVM